MDSVKQIYETSDSSHLIYEIIKVGKSKQVS